MESRRLSTHRRPTSCDKLGHKKRRVKGRGGIEDDSNLLAGVVEGTMLLGSVLY